MSAATQPAFVFDPVKHIYTLDGRVLPSVTQILEAAGLVDFSGVPEGVLGQAAWRGSAVHRACHLDDEGDLDESTVEPEHRGYLDAWRKFKREVGFQATAIEEQRYHDKYLYAGTPDRIGKVGGCSTVIDLKTSTSLQPATAIQLAAYVHLWIDFPMLYRRMAVRLRSNGLYSVAEYGRRDLLSDWHLFLSCLSIFNWKESNL